MSPGSLTPGQVFQAIDGDRRLLDGFMTRLREALEPVEINSVTLAPRRVRIDLQTKEVESIHTRNDRLFGPLVGVSGWQVYETAAKRTPVKPHPMTAPRTQTGWWPRIHLQRDMPFGEQGVVYSVNYFNLLGLLAMALILARLLALLLGCVGVEAARRGWFRVGSVVLLVLLLALAARLNAFTSVQTAPRRFNPVFVGRWFTADSVEARLDDPGGASALLREMAGDINGFAEDDSLAITVTREFDPSALRSSAPVSVLQARSTDVRFPGVGICFQYSCVTYAQDRSPETPLLVPRSSWWTRLVDHGALSLNRGTARAEYNAGVMLLPLILLLSTPWFLWRIINGVEFLRTRRIQHRRVNKGQCIYCAYKLSPAVLAVRWDDHSRGS